MAFSPWAMRNLLDNHQRATHPGLTVYLRVENAVDDEEEFVTYGFQVAVTGSELAGTSDIEIEPPPDVQALSQRDIGLLGANLKFGAHSFLISHTWVLKRMEELALTDPRQVFRAANVVGIVYQERLYSIEELKPEDVHNETISWMVLGNALEPIEEC